MVDGKGSGGDDVAVHCHEIRLHRPRGVFVSEPAGDGKVRLKADGGRFVAVGSKRKWLWHCREGIRTVAECTDSELFSVEMLSDGLCRLSSAENTFLSAVSDYELRWSNGTESECQRWTVIVDGDDSEGAATTTTTTATAETEGEAGGQSAGARSSGKRKGSTSRNGAAKKRQSGIMDAMAAAAMDDLQTDSDGETDVFEADWSRSEVPGVSTKNNAAKKRRSGIIEALAAASMHEMADGDELHLETAGDSTV